MPSLTARKPDLQRDAPGINLPLGRESRCCVTRERLPHHRADPWRVAARHSRRDYEGEGQRWSRQRTMEPRFAGYLNLIADGHAGLEQFWPSRYRPLTADVRLENRLSDLRLCSQGEE